MPGTALKTAYRMRGIVPPTTMTTGIITEARTITAAATMDLTQVMAMVPAQLLITAITIEAVMAHPTVTRLITIMTATEAETTIVASLIKQAMK